MDLSFNQTLLIFLILCETKLEGSINFRNFSGKCYLPSLVLQFVWRSRLVFSPFLDLPGNLKNIKEKHLCSYPLTKKPDYPSLVKKRLPFARDLFAENSNNFYLCFRLALLHSVSYFFLLCGWPSSSLCTVFMLFHPK